MMGHGDEEGPAMAGSLSQTSPQASQVEGSNRATIPGQDGRH